MKATAVWWLNTTYACGGVIVRSGNIVDACPIYRRWVGQPLTKLVNALKRKGQFIEIVQTTAQ